MEGMGKRDLTSEISAYVAIGDSFTEGLHDPGPGGGYLGWADRVAGVLSARRPGFRYANLAIRGKLLDQVIAEQLPPAVEMAPDLVSLAAGGNDILSGADVDLLAAQFEPAVAKLQAAGCRVLIFTGFDPRMFPVIRLLRGRIATYNMHLRGIADETGCDLVDLWSMRALNDTPAWSPDRLHLSAEGHRRVALRPARSWASRSRRTGGCRRLTPTTPATRTARARPTAAAGWPRRHRDARGPSSTRCRGSLARLIGASSGDGSRPSARPAAARRGRPGPPRPAGRATSAIQGSEHGSAELPGGGALGVGVAVKQRGRHPQPQPPALVAERAARQRSHPVPAQQQPRQALVAGDAMPSPQPVRDRREVRVEVDAACGAGADAPAAANPATARATAAYNGGSARSAR